jgi:release factor glutamine methyltransferase
MISLNDLISSVCNMLSKAGIDSSEAETELIISHFLNLKKKDIFLQPERQIDSSLWDTIMDIAARRAKHYPLQYLLGSVEFYNSILKISPQVLIPRPETEILVEIILSQNSQKHLHLLEIGTGSGAIAIALKKERPNWQITATDISPAALNIARLNAESNNCQIKFLLSNLFQKINSTYDIIVSNPPYISEEIYKYLAPEIFYEPKNALTAPQDGLYFIKNIIDNSPEYLNRPASIYLEIGDDQAGFLQTYTQKLYADHISFKNDYNGFRRYLIITYS